jgi:N-acetylglucosaminyl-diphospho-decaprenol L-rhamnosyltransferase
VGRVELTVVVVSFNTRQLLERCLASLDRSAGVTLKVVVVDNASADGSADMVRERFPRVELREPGGNLGFAAANNVALRDLDTPFVLLLNPDTEVVDDAAAALVRFLKEHPRAGAVGGRLLYGDGSFQHSGFAFPTLAQVFLDVFPVNYRLTGSRLNGRYPRAWYGRAFEVDHPLGACFCVRREAVQLMDEDFFMYAEEVDLARRIRDAGWEIWYTPDATVIHHEAQATRQFRGEMMVQLHRSRYRFFAKHYGSWFGLAARAIVGTGVLRDLGRSAAARIGGRIDAEEWRKRREVYGRVLAL